VGHRREAYVEIHQTRLPTLFKNAGCNGRPRRAKRHDKSFFIAAEKINVGFFDRLISTRRHRERGLKLADYSVGNRPMMRGRAGI
jgi:hypothetical protein